MQENEYTPSKIYTDAVLKTDLGIVNSVEGKPYLPHWKGLSMDWARRCLETIFKSMTIEWETRDLHVDDEEMGLHGVKYTVTNFTADTGVDFSVIMICDDDDHEVLKYISACAWQDDDIPLSWMNKYIDKVKNGTKPDFTDRPGRAEGKESDMPDFTVYEMSLLDCISDYFGMSYMSNDYKFTSEDPWDQARLIHYASGRLYRFMKLMVYVLKRLSILDNLLYGIRLASVWDTSRLTVEETIGREGELGFIEDCKKVTEKEIKFLKALFEKDYFSEDEEEGTEVEDDEDDDDDFVPLTEEEIKNHPLNIQEMP